MIIRDTKLKGLRGFIDRIRNMGKEKVLVGVPSSANSMHEGGTINMATLAAVHEFGSPSRGIPERSFLRSAVLEHKADIKNFIMEGTQAYLQQKKDIDLAFYNKIGLFAANLVKDKILKGPFVPLSATTIERKGSSKPLIDTGALRQSITWTVRK